MKEGVKKKAGDLALAQALVFTHSRDLTQLNLNEFYQRLKIVPLPILALKFDMLGED